MRLKLIVCIAMCFAILGCKKNSSTTNLVLKNIISGSASSSLKFSFYYDANGRFIQLIDSALPQRTRNVYYYDRNPAGYITGYSVNGFSMDWAVTTNVDAGGHYFYLITNWSPSDKDSTVTTYIGNRITGYINYYTNGSGYNPVSKDEFQYDSNGNLVQEDWYEFGSGWTLTSRTSYTYDSKTNPQQLGNEYLIINGGYLSFGNMLFLGPNNVLSRSYEDFMAPSNSSTQTYTYTYNSNNMPVSAIGTITPGGQTTTVNYIYY
jgi:hypothetical protein